MKLVRPNALLEGPLRIQGVAQATGVAAPTLRAWERRYGVPAPARTASSYRLYGPDDVREIERMRDLCASGLAASQAASTVIQERAARPAEPDAREGGFAQAVVRLVAATARMDVDAFDRELALAAELGNASTIFESVIGPALVRIGDAWECGEMSIAQEHFASTRAASFARSLLKRVEPSDPAAPKVLLAAFDGEDHSIPLLGVALRFAAWGYRPIELGARTPPVAVREAMRLLAPAFVALSVTLPVEPARARTLAKDYAAAAGAVPWIVGGAGVDSVAAHVTRRGGVVCREPLANLHGIVRKALAAHRKSERRVP